MTDRRLPSKIIAKKKHSRVIFWGILIAFISAVSGFLLIYFLDEGKDILNDSNFIASDNTEVENKDPSWEESVYNFEDMDKFEEDVIADQAVENSELVQIFKEQERSAKSPVKKEPKWLKNAAPRP